MKIKYNELRRDYKLNYEFEGETVIVTYNNEITDEFNFSQLGEGDKFQGVDTEIPVQIFKSAERVDGELYIELMKPYGAEIAKEVMRKGDDGFLFSRDWQEVS